MVCAHPPLSNEACARTKSCALRGVGVRAPWLVCADGEGERVTSTCADRETRADGKTRAGCGPEWRKVGVDAGN
jgi:hypothetical protein